MHSKPVLSRAVGYFASLVFTASSFTIFFRPDFFHLDLRGNIVTLFILAGLQCTVQSVFFLHILSEKGPRWNLVVFSSTISMIFIIIFFSVWIINHLNYNMGI